MMAHGVITVAHNSGGPKSDIVITSPEDKRNGFLADTPEGYADAFSRIMDENVDVDKIRKNAIASVSRFSDEEFCKRIVEIVKIR